MPGAAPGSTGSQVFVMTFPNDVLVSRGPQTCHRKGEPGGQAATLEIRGHGHIQLDCAPSGGV